MAINKNIFLFIYLIIIIHSVYPSAPINLSKLSTETRNPDTMNLDKMSSLEIVTAMNNEDMKVPMEIKKHLKSISKAVDWAAGTIQSGARIFYIGAGTSGRIAISDAAECPPTFGAPPDLFVAMMAGGDSAFLKAVEGAEDSEFLAREDLREKGLTSKDLVIGIASSGRTPYVIGGIKYAKSIGCRTISLTCNKNSELSSYADLPLEIIVGPEVLTGSTRLKAGTAQKLILNMISTGAMVKSGKTFENLMVDLMITNEKLQVRAENNIMITTGVSRNEAKKILKKSDGNVKLGIMMTLGKLSKEEAIKKLNENGGHIREALGL